MASPAQPTCTGTGFFDSINCGSGAALNTSYTGPALLAAIAGSLASFGIQLLIFLLLRLRLSRIYRPRSYLVPERERVAPPPRGVIRWLGPIFTTPNLAFIQKCGLDAYFFLRYLRMLLKFFLPVALVALPILLPINRFSGNLQKGLDLLAINNVSPEHVGHRFWAHLLIAVGVIAWFCYVVYQELRGYIRVRQAFLTSPQHRIRASATTVLVTGIPRKWLTLEALSGLYDVFPGGIKNIWINRNFDELSDKVQLRDKYARQLEDAETGLVKKCRKAHEKKLKQERRKEGKKKRSKQEAKRDREAENAMAEQMAQGDGVSAGDQHATPHGLQDILHDAEEHEEREHEKEEERHSKHGHPLGIVGEGLDKVGLGAVNQGLGAVGQGFGAFGRGVGMFGQRVVGDVDAGFHNVGKGFDDNINAANNGQGFATDDELYRQSILSQSDGAPTPPPKTPAVERDARLQANQQAMSAPLHSQGTPARADFAQKSQHPLATHAAVSRDEPQPSPASERTLHQPELQLTRPSVESRPPRSPLEIEDPSALQPRKLTWRLWKNNDRSLAMPSPQPHVVEEDEFPLNVKGPHGPADHPTFDKDMSGSKLVEKLTFWKKKGEEEAKPQYPSAIDKDWDEDQDEEPRWRHYIEPKARDTIRLPLVDQGWFPSLPLVGKKVDRIYWLRRELARLNLEIEADQNDVERFPFMNSAFIQFNHQVAAHMACQSLSHHVPQQMAPRILEISPDDVLWDNMSIKWWERYARTGLVIVVCAGLIILYAVPVSFTSIISKLSTLSQNPDRAYDWLRWVTKLPTAATAIIQGLLPPILLNVILLLVPIIFRLLVKQQGVPTGNAQELGVQTWYFAFLFIQVFFVVTISGGLTTFFSTAATNPGETIRSLAYSLPRAADYFFSYLLVQALSNSASALLQTGTLFMWFIIGPILDSTPRQKWARQTNLSNLQWGSFFPVFTNFATIGIVYSVIAPFMLIFMVIIFSVFWVAYRYNVLYVYQFKNDTGGLLFPTAVNQLFVGVYFLEVCLCGYFFISQGPTGNLACIPQGAVMVVVIIFTILYQWQLNKAFDPLFQYLPITLEDEAVIRDEQFAKAQASKFAPLNEGQGSVEDDRDIQDQLEDRERVEEDANDAAEEKDRRNVERHRRSSHLSALEDGDISAPPRAPGTPKSVPGTPHTPSWKTDRWRKVAPEAVARLHHLANARQETPPTATTVNPQTKTQPTDMEAQNTVGDVLFSGFADELEDLTPEERDLLVRYAFQHSALRAKRPVVWIPRDKLGVSDDEIKRAKKMSTVQVPAEFEEKGGAMSGYANGKGGGNGGRMVEKTNIWMSNEGTALDGEGRVVFRRSPPDFSNVDLIAL